MFRTKVVEKIKSRFIFSIAFFENRAVYEKKCENVVEPGRPHMTV